jgi:hypothetical protein
MGTTMVSPGAAGRVVCAFNGGVRAVAPPPDGRPPVRAQHDRRPNWLIGGCVAGIPSTIEADATGAVDSPGLVLAARIFFGLLTLMGGWPTSSAG